MTVVNKQLDDISRATYTLQTKIDDIVDDAAHKVIQASMDVAKGIIKEKHQLEQIYYIDDNNKCFKTLKDLHEYLMDEFGEYSLKSFIIGI